VPLLEITLSPRAWGFAGSPPSGTWQRKGMPRAVKKARSKPKTLQNMGLPRAFLDRKQNMSSPRAFLVSSNNYFANGFHLADDII
jgi:hypothetical protein